MKKKILALCLVVVLAVTAVTGATLAYFTDQDKANNVFTVGNLNIELKEEGKVELNGTPQPDKLVPNKDPEGKEDGDDYGYTYKDLVPGNVITKAPTITNKGTNPAYVRVAVVMNNLHEINNAIDEVYENLAQPKDDAGIQAVYDEIFNGWNINYAKNDTHANRMWMSKPDNNKVLAIDMAAEYKGYNGGATWWNIDTANTFKKDADNNAVDGTIHTAGSYYDKAIVPGERVYVYYLQLDSKESYTLFDGLKVPTDFDGNRAIAKESVADTDNDFRIDQMAMFNNLKIGIYVDAIQQEGFTDWKDAIAALETAHPLGSDYYTTVE